MDKGHVCGVLRKITWNIDKIWNGVLRGRDHHARCMSSSCAKISKTVERKAV